MISRNTISLTPRIQDFEIYKGETSKMKILVDTLPIEGMPIRAYLRRTVSSTKVLARMEVVVLEEKETIYNESTQEYREMNVIELVLNKEDSNKLIINQYQSSFYYDVFFDSDCVAYGKIKVIGASSNEPIEPTEEELEEKLTDGIIKNLLKDVSTLKEQYEKLYQSVYGEH